MHLYSYVTTWFFVLSFCHLLSMFQLLPMVRLVQLHTDSNASVRQKQGCSLPGRKIQNVSKNQEQNIATEVQMATQTSWHGIFCMLALLCLVQIELLLHIPSITVSILHLTFYLFSQENSFYRKFMFFPLVLFLHSRWHQPWNGCTLPKWNKCCVAPA